MREKIHSVLLWIALILFLYALNCVVFMIWHDFDFWAKMLVTDVILLFIIALTEKALRQHENGNNDK